jgi:hypothetical protein
MQQYINEVAARFALLNQILPRTATFSQEQVLARLSRMEQPAGLARQYPDQLQAVLSSLDYVKKNCKQQSARLYICFIVFEKIQQSVLQRRHDVQDEADKLEDFLHDMRTSALFQTQGAPIEHRLREKQGLLKMFDIFGEQLNKSWIAMQELEAIANQLVFNSEQASVVIFRAMDMKMPGEAVMGMVRELDQVCSKVDSLKNRIDRLEAQVKQAMAEAERLDLPYSL